MILLYKQTCYDQSSHVRFTLPYRYNTYSIHPFLIEGASQDRITIRVVSLSIPCQGLRPDDLRNNVRAYRDTYR